MYSSLRGIRSITFKRDSCTMKLCKTCHKRKPNKEFYTYRKACIACYNRGIYYRQRYRSGKWIRFEPAMTEQQIGQILGISKQRVQQILHTALCKLRRTLNELEWTESSSLDGVHGRLRNEAQ